MTQPISTLIDALMAGANAVATNLATTAIHETYDGLKAQVIQHSTQGIDLRQALAEIESRSDTSLDEMRIRLSNVLSESLSAATADENLLLRAERLSQLIAAEEEAIAPPTVTLERSVIPKGAPTRGAAATSSPSQRGTSRPQTTPVDPNLQRIIAKNASAKNLVPKSPVGTRGAAPIDSETDTPLIDLVGQLKDPAIPIRDLNIVRQLDDLFTATISAENVAEIAAHENIHALEMAVPVAPNLAHSVSEIGATPFQLRQQLPAGVDVPDGQGVIVGIIDYGCDFAHDNFRHEIDGKTRLLALWHQDGSPTAGNSPSGFGYGQEFTADMIAHALEVDGDPYTLLGYKPETGSHGTHVMDIAAGNGRATGNPGVAPAADIIFVHISEEGSGNAKHLVEAADYIFQKASELGKPAVVNMSLGTHKGPHDGSTLSERWLDKLLDTPDRAIVVSAGNSFRHRAHACGTVPAEATIALPWIIRPTDPTDNEVELWYGGEHRLDLTLRGPDGLSLATVPPGQRFSIPGMADNEAVSIIHNLHDPRNGDNQISIRLDKAFTAAAASTSGSTHWQIELRAINNVEVPFHAWIERDDAKRDSLSFFHPQVVQTSHSLGSISCGHKTITVGSYRAGDPQKSISRFSSQGPTRDDRHKPEISAPGEFMIEPKDDRGVLAAEALTNGTTRKGGTSMAAPHVTGLIALMLQLADRPMDVESIRARLIEAARSEPLGNQDWHPQYGYGCLDAAALLLSKK